MSAVSTARPKKIDPLAKKIPQNPKYSHVRSTIDTGASVTKYMNKIEEIRKNYKLKHGEIFKRMKVTTFAQLVIQVHRINTDFELADPSGDRPDTADLEVQRVSGSPTPSLAVSESDFGRGEPETSRSTLERVAGGLGEMDLNRPPTPPGEQEIDLPYLLLDVRDRDDFDKCHIISAKNYPKAMLSRSVNFETKEMLSYKNSQGRIIIIVDEDERLAPEAATTLVQRGYDNLFLLSGGIKMAHKTIPDGFITGTPPSISGKTPKFVEPATQTCFTEDDINCMEIHLDKALEDKSTGSSSRLSKASTASSRYSNMSSRSVRTAASGGVSGRQPFK